MRWWSVAAMIGALALALGATPTVARAEETKKWGFAVYEEDGTFITSRWPDAATFEIGSGPSSLIRLPRLQRRHAIFFVTDDGFSVIPIGPVRVNRKRAAQELTSFQPEDEILVGDYRFQFFRETDPGQYEVPAEAPKEAEVAQAEAEEGAPSIDPAEVAERAGAARSPEYRIDAYRFCHDPNFGKKGTDGSDFCAIFDETTDEVCPEARKHCPQWKALPPLCFIDEEGGEPSESDGDPDNKGFICKGGKQGSSGQGKEPNNKARIARRQPSPLSFDLRIPAWLGWTMIVALVGLVLFWFIKSLKDAGWESDETPPDDGAGLTEAERNLQELPEARSNVLLKLAERSLAKGDAREAAILVHLAILRYLDDEGLVRYHPSRTNGDYLRAIRRHKDLASLFRRVANQTERIRFGDGNVEESALRQDLEDARRRLVKRTVEAEDSESPPAPSPLGAATALALCFLAMSQASCDEPLDPAYHSRGPIGLAALPAILKSSGLSVEIARQKLEAIAPDVGVVVIRDSATDIKHWPENLKVDALLDRGMAVVVIDDLWKSKFFLPVTATIAKNSGAVGLQLDVADSCAGRFLPLLELAADEAVKVPYGRRVTWPSDLRTATAAATSKTLALHPLLGYHDQPRIAGNPAALAVAAKRYDTPERRPGAELPGCLYLFTDRDLFTNASLTRASNAKFVTGFFAALVPDGKRIMFLDRLDQWTVSGTSPGEDKKDPENAPAKALKASNMLAFIIQASIALIAMYVLLGAAFGPLRDPVMREHKAFVEHVEAIGRQYARTGVMGLTHAARQLARLVVMRQRDRVRGGAAGWSAVSQHLAQKLGLDEKDVRAALRLGIDGVSELGAPTPDDPTPSSDRMLRTLSRLLGGRDQAASLKRTNRARR